MKRFLLFVAVLCAGALAYVHWFLPGQVESRMNRVLTHAPYSVGARATRLHESLFVADLHSDSLLWKRDLLARSDVGHMDLPRLREGNVALQVFSATTKSPDNQNYSENAADSDRITLLTVLSFWPPATWTSLYERAAYQLNKLTELTSSGEVFLLRSAEDVGALEKRRAAGESVLGAVYLIEGAHPLEGDIGNLDRLFDQGLRIVGLTHFFDNELGGSLHGKSRGGLTDFGREVIRRANELEMIIDIAHASPAMVRDVLSLSNRPVMLSHGGLRGHCDSPRNLDDELMLEVAHKGGLVGVGFWGGAICDPSPAGVVRAIRYGIELLGIDHVALGSDFDGTVATTFDVSELAVLTEEMLVAGFTEREIRAVMGDNVRQFLTANLPED